MSVFFTGFPGLIGSALLERLVDQRPDERFVCLVQPRHHYLAEQRLRALDSTGRGACVRTRLLDGDITDPSLGLRPQERQELLSETTEVFHLAAVYDLTVPESLAMAVNVGGTQNVLDFARGCQALRRLQYVSTFAIAGHHAGRFHETDLDLGQPLRNHYVRSKLLAEVEVQKAMADGVPTTIYRPGMVVGDTTTGLTQKYDGPYFLIRWMLRQPSWLAVVPAVGDPTRTRPNIVPRDFVVDAIAALSCREQTAGVVYNLTDPNPPSADEVVDLLSRATGRRVIRVSLPLGFLKRALAVGPLARAVGIPAEVMDYFDHPTTFDCSNTLRDLAGTGIGCPPFASYVAVLVRFVVEHPEIGSDAMI